MHLKKKEIAGLITLAFIVLVISSAAYSWLFHYYCPMFSLDI